MQIAILGPLEVMDEAGCAVQIAGARLRTLLCRLAVDAGRPVSTAALVDAVWGDTPPAEETNALQTLVSRLRRALGTSVVAQSPSGYTLTLAPGQTDVGRFRASATDGSAALRRGAHREALPLLEDALALWRGPALADVRDSADALGAYAVELDDLRLTTGTDLGEVQLALDPGAVDVPELERLVAAYPLNERITALLIRALAATGRAADALRAYETVRGRLADELGVDPSAELRQLHLSLVRGEHTDERTVRHTNLKAQLTSFVGRDDEIARIVKSLEQSRLVTLVGPGGAGKTRLAVEAAARNPDQARDGIWMVELAPVVTGADVPQAVLASVGLRDFAIADHRTGLTPRDAFSRLRDGFADRAAVIVLDNCEHVVDAAARLAEQLLGECPELRVLATSREPLGIFGEALIVVPPLAQPAPTVGAAEAIGYPAVRLFVDRAEAVRPDFVLDEAALPAVTEIVSRLDGLPLAIELAAARLRTMPLADIAARLGDRFRLLTGGSRTALPRHRTLRAVVEWSWGLLTDDERVVAERLAVFPSGITLATAAAVCDDVVAADDVEDVLASLIDKSLLQPTGDGRRMRMLETIREYGAERLGERGELGVALARHADHFAALLAEAEPHLITAAQLPWFALVSAERENIVAALRFRCDTGDADGALRIAVGLGGAAMMLGEHAEITVWTADALAVPGATDTQARLAARALLALNATASGEFPPGVEVTVDEVVEELRHVDLGRDSLTALLRPAVAFFSEEPGLTEVWAQELLLVGSEWARAATHMFLGLFADNNGDVDTMRRETEVALEAFRGLGERWGLASALRSQAQLCTSDGDLDGAAEAYEESLTLMREITSTEDEVYIYQRLADLSLRRGDTAGALRHLADAEASMTAGRSSVEALMADALRAEIAWRMDDMVTARRLCATMLADLARLPETHPVLGHARSLVLTCAARVTLDDGDEDAAVALGVSAHAAARPTRDRPIVAFVGVLLADLLRHRGDVRDAAVAFGATARLRGTDDPTALDIIALRTRLVDALGADGFGVAYDEGRALPQEAALALLDSVQERLR